MAAGAALVRRIAELTAGTGLPDVDLRPGGLRVRISPAGNLTRDDVELARSISMAAQDLGLAADPAVLQTVRLVIETADRPSLVSFWQTVLAYEPAGAGGLRDPSRRDPMLSFHESRPRPLRDRIHVDVVRAPEAVETARAAVGQVPFGAYGVRAFWASVLGYRHDPRAFLTDLYDPRRLDPVLFFQPMDASDTQRRQHRNRIHVELFVPYDQARARIDTAVAAGGRIVTANASDRRTLIDPEGNELDIRWDVVGPAVYTYGMEGLLRGGGADLSGGE